MVAATGLAVGLMAWAEGSSQPWAYAIGIAGGIVIGFIWRDSWKPKPRPRQTPILTGADHADQMVTVTLALMALDRSWQAQAAHEDRMAIQTAQRTGWLDDDLRVAAAARRECADSLRQAAVHAGIDLG
jgi:hypothetical protein